MIRAFLLILISIPLTSLAQIKQVGTQGVKNHPDSYIHTKTQNWGITQDTNGFIYFANNNGLLSYDGVQWDLLPISSDAPLRSVFTDSNNNLYVGLINDFGIIQRETPAPTHYKSLKSLIPKGLGEFDDVWRIHEIDGTIVFQCFKYLFLLKDNEVKVLKPQKLFRFSFKIENRLFIQEPGLGLFELVDGELKKLALWEKQRNMDVNAIVKVGTNKTLLGTTSHGIYLSENGRTHQWKTQVNDFVLKNRLYCATLLPGNYVAFGTILKGLVIADLEGNIIQTLNGNNRIQNNTILSLHVDQTKNLWLGLDNGIDYVETNSPLSFINSKNLGAGYCCKIFKGNLYIGTNQGLYVRPFNAHSNNKDFELVKNSAGQVWSLDIFDGKLICGHNLGTFEVTGKQARKISDEEGAWKYIPLNDHPGLLLGGHYQGLVLLKKVKEKWQFLRKIKGYEESSRYMETDQYGNIWIGHSGRGISRITLNAALDSIREVKHFATAKGLPAKTGNILFKYRGEIYSSTNAGIYQYDRISERFISSTELNELFANCGKVKTVVTDESGDVWFIADKESGVIHCNEDMTLTLINRPFKKLNKEYINEFEYIYPHNKENVFIGTKDGFIHYAPNIPKSYDHPFKAFITRIELPYLDSTLYLHSVKPSFSCKLPGQRNAFRFHFAAPFYENEYPLQFSYFLEGYSEKWSEWSADNYKDFTTLNEGDYKLKLKAKNIFGIVSEPTSFSFEITPPWYRATEAYLAYFLFLLISIYLTTRAILHRIRQSKLQQEQRHQLEMQKKEEKFHREALIAEKEIIKLRNETLRGEMVHRDKELANQTMGIIHKNKFLMKVNEDLNAIQDSIVNEQVKGKIVSLKKKIKKEVDIKLQNKIFETHFDEVHKDFFKTLKDKFPQLTSKDLRICAFIRMNLNTQEIATILNISYRGAEIRRYRLRKKLELDRSTNLSSFLTNF